MLLGSRVCAALASQVLNLAGSQPCFHATLDSFVALWLSPFLCQWVQGVVSHVKHCTSPASVMKGFSPLSVTAVYLLWSLADLVFLFFTRPPP